MADAAIIVNQAQRPTLAGRLRPGTPITVVPQFSSGPEPARTHDLGDPVALLTVTNLEFRSKADGVIRLVDHLAAFAATDGRRLRLTVAGGGAELPCIEAVLAARKLPDTLEVVPLGFVRDVEPLYAEADLFLYHSEHDATPSVILESKRHGLPLLANDHAPFRTLVAHGETGFLFRDAAQFHDLFARLLDEAALRERLGTAARADHRARFTVEAVGPPLEAAIAAAVRAGRRSTRRAAP